MKISVIGCGFLGAVHAAALASLGHTVVGIDTDQAKVDLLSAGEPPFYEPGLPQLLREGVASGRLTFSVDLRAAADADLHYIAVGTPQRADSQAADTQYLYAALRALLPLLQRSDGGPVVIAGKSTVPVGTAADLATLVADAGAPAVLVWNPEFLREGTAVADTLHPDRMVYGMPADADAAAAARRVLDDVFGQDAESWPVIETDYATAELVKVAANSFLAMKVSFINAMAALCDASGADISQLAHAIGIDKRIGRRYLRAGPGYGGGCLPKDVRALAARAAELGAEDAVGLMRQVDTINQRQRQRVADIVVEMLDGDIAGARVAVLGASFKPDSDDVRDSPALSIAHLLARAGATVVVTDPHAGPAIESDELVTAAADPARAAADADVVVLLTEWSDYLDLDPDTLPVAHKRIVDGRNALDAGRWVAAGWRYRGIGRR